MTSKRKRSKGQKKTNYINFIRGLDNMRKKVSADQQNLGPTDSDL